MNGPVTGMYLNRTALQYGRHRRSLFIGGEKMRAWTEVNTASGEFQSMPKGLAHYSSPLFAARWFLPLALCSLADSRRSAPTQRIALEWKRGEYSSTGPASASPQCEVREFLFSVFQIARSNV